MIKQQSCFYVCKARLAILCTVLFAYQAAAAATHAAGHDRSLLILIQPDIGSTSVSFDSSLRRKSPDIAANDPRVMKQAAGCTLPEQVHLTYWSSTSVLVSWATCDAQIADRPLSAMGSSDSSTSSIVLYGTMPGLYDKANVGSSTSYVYDYTDLKQASYASPLLHHVLLQDLQPGVTYFYLPTLRTARGVVAYRAYNFTMPLARFPFRIGAMGDPGQTYNTSAMLDSLLATQPALVMCIGDFSYADDWMSMDQHVDAWHDGKYSYQPKWDTFGRLLQPLLSRVPLIHTDGNHELERQPNGLTHVAYNYRYPVPQNSTSAPVHFTGTNTDVPYANLYYAVELPGVFKAIMLTSYSPQQISKGFSSDQEQFVWLQQELEKTDRSITPWLIVLLHSPWYTSYNGHFKENECMRETYEWLLVKYGVDIVMSGHVHAYERTKPVRDYQVDECGPVHIIIGNGGNTEGMYDSFIDTAQPKPNFCSDPESGEQFPSYSPHKCLTWQNGDYCPTSQPHWSAYREPSFGHGTLDLLNATHALWTWTKNQGPSFNAADQVTLVRRPDKQC